MEFYKTTKRNGMSFHGNVKYEIGKTVRKMKCDNPQLCTSDVLHASPMALGALSYANTLDCNLYIVEGEPVVSDGNKSGFFSLKVLREIPDIEKDELFGFRYNEALHPVNPCDIESEFSDADVVTLKKWASVWASLRASLRDSVWDSVWDSVRDSVWASVRDSVWASVWASLRASVRDSVRDSVWDSVRDSVRDSVWDSVRDSVWDSVRDSVWAYTGSLFPNVEKRYGVEYAKGVYPFQPAADLWKRGFIPVLVDGKWSLYHPVKDKPAILVYKED